MPAQPAELLYRLVPEMFRADHAESAVSVREGWRQRVGFTDYGKFHRRLQHECGPACAGARCAPVRRAEPVEFQPKRSTSAASHQNQGANSEQPIRVALTLAKSTRIKLARRLSPWRPPGRSSAKNRRTKRHPSRQPPKAREGTQRILTLLHSEGAQILTNNHRHGLA